MRHLSQRVVAAALACCALAVVTATAHAASFKLPPKPADDPWPEIAPIDPAMITTANADPRVQRGYQLLVNDGGNWAGNEAGISFQFAAAHGNLVAQAASCAVDLANSRGEGQATWSLRTCRPAAEQGYGAAQLMVGLLYQVAGLEYDPRKAAHWLRQAARQGNAIAVLFLAEAYLKGQGVPADRKAGHDLLSQLDTSAQRDGLRAYARYLRDDEPDKDAATRSAGRKALQAAVLAEFWPAQLRLSWLSRSGADGAPKDTEAAHLYGNDALNNLIRAIVTPRN